MIFTSEQVRHTSVSPLSTFEALPGISTGASGAGEVD